MNKSSKASAKVAYVAPTMRTASWAVTDFLNAAERVCSEDQHSNHVRMYFYAATEAGWRRLGKCISRWRGAQKDRSVTAYIGTDHGLTDPDALKVMHSEGVEVRLMRHYKGIFHPKVIWFVGEARNTILAGSNNLTEDGLKNNIEFATVTTLEGVDNSLKRWHNEIHKASELASEALVKSYAKEKEKHGQKQAISRTAGEFIWSKRTSGPQGGKANGTASANPKVATTSRRFILEVMPRETSEEGRQIQIPLAAARTFFGLGSVAGSSINITLNNVDTNESRVLAFTLNRNSTARLSIRELEYRSRPCIVIFTRRSPKIFDFELIRRAIDPSRYDALLAECEQPPSGRRWKL